jgi:Holliday junction resolvase-like predicted endonuclease
MLKFRCSSLADIMTEPKSKTETLSAGAKTAIEKIAKEFVYGYDSIVSTKYMTKGIECEDQSIELLNSVLFTDYKKNTERRTNDWITGEADIVAPDAILDIKTSWSLDTFPVLAEIGENKTYWWQMQAYMWLWDKPRAEVCYCLIDTPEDLIGYENRSLHQVSHIAPELRVTRWKIDRDDEAIAKIAPKVEAAREYYQQIIDRIVLEHS